MEEVKTETLEQSEAEITRIDEEAAKVTDAVVTSVHEEEKKSGERVEFNAEQSRLMAANQHTSGMKIFNDLSRKLSARALRRIITGLFKLPYAGEKIVSKFQSEQEKFIFDIGQKILAAKYALLYDYMMAQRKLDLEAKASAPVTQEVTSQEQPKEEKTNGTE